MLAMRVYNTARLRIVGCGLEEFDDIRPYRDDEVPVVIRRLLGDDELIDFLMRYDAPRLSRIAPWLARWTARRKLTAAFGEVGSIGEFQRQIAHWAKRIVDETMASFECTGIERLDPSSAYLFISNHRDIAGDSMLVDYVLHQGGYGTACIAVGDNLVQRDFATDLMKLNKSFFIRRAGSSRRNVYAALLESSRFIHELLAKGESVWIAQAEGRAKDGMDVTDPALIRMLSLARRKRPFGDVIRDLRIVPVTVSYEYDPCDLLKARELHALATAGRYVKPAGEDLVSLARGLSGWKGRVRLAFGEVLVDDYDTTEAVARALDEQIVGNLALFPINLQAFETLAVDDGMEPWASAWPRLESSVEPGNTDAELKRRLGECPEAWRVQLLSIYANPVLNKLDHGPGVHGVSDRS